MSEDKEALDIKARSCEVSTNLCQRLVVRAILDNDTGQSLVARSSSLKDIPVNVVFIASQYSRRFMYHQRALEFMIARWYILD